MSDIFNACCLNPDYFTSYLRQIVNVFSEILQSKMHICVHLFPSTTAVQVVGVGSMKKRWNFSVRCHCTHTVEGAAGKRALNTLWHFVAVSYLIWHLCVFCAFI